jgi:hypothetical protein
VPSRTCRAKYGSGDNKTFLLGWRPRLPCPRPPLTRHPKTHLTGRIFRRPGRQARLHPA